MIEIREANLNDLQELIECRLELLVEARESGSERNCEALKSRLEAYFTENLGKEFFAYVGTHEGKIVGTSGLNIVKKTPTFSNLSGLEGYIMNMYVKKDFRGHGVATNLIKKLLELLKERDIKRVRLLATERGSHVYSKLGFKKYRDGMVMDL
ncbi:MAG: GNAT family N-acetyltransferase [Fusobacteria bacterium]|nr:GNAT family N-acetyltransferase [Fusobacteriota bacterium]